MPPVPIFHGLVSADGERLELAAEEHPMRRAYLRRLAGKPVDVVVKVHRQQRSVDQNAWLWGVAYPLIAADLGYDLDEHERLHYALVDECFGTTYDTRLKKAVPVVRSSSLTTVQFSDYMEWLVRWAAREHGIIVPLPNEAEVG